MYIYFDKNGTIKEVINDESIRRGSNDYNKIYCYLEGNPSIDDIWYLQKNPDGTLTNEVSFVDNIVTKSIPYDSKRDMKYFQDFEEYKFYVFTLSSSYLSQNGLVVATIRVAENNTLWALGELTFNVQANIVNSDNDITQSQYDYLLTIMTKKADKTDVYTKNEVDYGFAKIDGSNVDTFNANDFIMDGISFKDTLFDYTENVDITNTLTLTNHYLDKANGNANPDTNSKCTDYIDLSTYTGFSISGHSQYATTLICTYDENKTFLRSYGDGTSAGETFTDYEYIKKSDEKFARFSTFQYNQYPLKVVSLSVFTPINKEKQDNYLFYKKYVACGDSFTAGDVISSDKVYPYLIAQRNNMRLVNMAHNGSYIHYGENGFTNQNNSYYYKNIPLDADIITIAYGLNETSTTIGTKESNDNTTIWGAYNEVLGWITTNIPNAKVGIISNDAWMTYELRNALQEIAFYWGVEFLDLKEYGKPFMISGKYAQDGDTNGSVVTQRTNQYCVSSTNGHPNELGHKVRSYIIENFLRGAYGVNNSYTKKEIDSLLQNLVESIGNVSENIEDLNTRTTDLENDVDSFNVQGKYIWGFKHLNSLGQIIDNGNKNVTLLNPLYCLKGTSVYVDNGYKYQIALYNKDTNAFIKRITWKYYGDVYYFDDEYLVIVEISDENENVLTDKSIVEHLHFILYSEIQSLNSAIENSSFSVEKEIELCDNSENLFESIDKDKIYNKTYCIQKPNKYNAWAFINSINDKLVCVYTKGLQHQNDNTMAIYCKVSLDGVVWTTERKIIDTLYRRDTITGKGKDTNGNMLFWDRLGEPNTPFQFVLFRSSDGIDFEPISSISFDNVCHIGDIISVENVGLVCFSNNYTTNNRQWGVLVSADNGITWTYTPIETGLQDYECPNEISPVYLGNGRILALGRRESSNDNETSMLQIQSNDYGTTWTKTNTNISDTVYLTPSLVLDGENLYLYYYKRGIGELRLIINSANSVWGNPTQWNNYEVIANGSTSNSDAGNVNAIVFNEYQIATYYSGDASNTGIYGCVKKFDIPPTIPSVIANPTLSGDEATLEGVEIDGTKYKVGGGSEVHLYKHHINIIGRNQNYDFSPLSVAFDIYLSYNTPLVFYEVREWLYNNGFSDKNNILSVISKESTNEVSGIDKHMIIGIYSDNYFINNVMQYTNGENVGKIVITFFQLEQSCVDTVTQIF